MDTRHVPETGDGQVNAPPAGMPVSFWRALEAQPYAHDLFNTLRWIDARAGARAPLGRAASPRAEPVRVRQEPSLAFAPATLARASAPREGRPGEISVYGFGLFGPNGPLPLHMTEHVRERVQHHGDRTLSAFADLFHHRAALLFYRAWADAQATASLDRGEDRFSAYVASLLHMGQPSIRRRDAVLDHAKYHMAGHLVRLTRNPEGLARILQRFFGVAVGLREFVPQWIRLEPAQRLRLGAAAGLGRDTLLGAAVRDAQHKFRLEIGPLDLDAYCDFLPGGRRARQLLHWVRQYVGIEFAWDARLALRAEHAEGVRLGGRAPLGLASWLGRRPASLGDARDVVIDYEARQRGRPPSNPENTNRRGENA
ncbi:type VI secretion system baseplate subunit TssG [Achromobacter sp. Marseille-Q4962]|uniref:type VI secretion system baseplate subunit TssG n=1 Tax=Achromobacter sp. Marseille-Q4962 TaxID=2942202 RepID=UPI0020743E79|nr:type VI secretion system baseplate subunit TssG [Achromobacter sp. Marseille-Q4962]